MVLGQSVAQAEQPPAGLAEVVVDREQFLVAGGQGAPVLLLGLLAGGGLGLGARVAGRPLADYTGVLPVVLVAELAS